MPASAGKVIISDTACLMGLTNIGQIDILGRLYGEIIVTLEVAREYGSPYQGDKERVTILLFLPICVMIMEQI